MKLHIITSLVAVLAITVAESAQPSRRIDNKSNGNLAVMLAYRPKSEIHTKDENNKRWSYRVSDEEKTSSEEELNKRLMDLLTKENLAKYFGDKETKNNKRSTVAATCSSSIESGESIDGVDVVEISKSKEDKKACYKNTYKNVLNAFEEALKSQINDYKKCVCQKKHKTTTTTTTTTEAVPYSIEEPENVDERAADSDELNKNKFYQNAPDIAAAVDNPEDFICFHKQYAKLLKALLDQLPCNKKSQPQLQLPSPAEMDEYNNEESSNDRNERQSAQSNESKSIEIAEANIYQKPAAMKENSNKLRGRGNIDNEDELKELILDVLGQYMTKAGSKREEKVVKPTPPIRRIEKKADEDVDNHDEFLEKLKQLFQQHESDGNSFPVRSSGTLDDSTASMSSRRLTKKSAGKTALPDATKTKKIATNEIPRRSTVFEESDESSEATIRVKNGKSEKQSYKAKEHVREQPNISTLANNKHNKSYRTATRTEQERNHNSLNEHGKKEATKVTKNSSTLNDDRLANDLAKAISDLARKYIKS